MTINGKETLFLTLAFIVPGFIWYCIQSAFMPRKAETPQILFLRFLTFSCFNYALWSWFIYIFLFSVFPKSHPRLSAFFWAMIILISPVLLGGLTGFLSQKEIIRSILNKMGLTSVHSIPTAWDYKFHNTRTCVWIQIELKDGKKIAGLYGSNSFASSQSNERDIYIQQAVKITDGKWEKLKRSNGVLVKGDQIKETIMPDKNKPNEDTKPQQINNGYQPDKRSTEGDNPPTVDDTIDPDNSAK